MGPRRMAPPPEDVAQRPPTLDAAQRAEVVAAVAREIDAGYVFPDKAREVSRVLQDALRTGVFDTFSEPTALARALTEHVQSVTRDKHLRVLDQPPPRRARLQSRMFGDVTFDGDIAWVSIETFGIEADEVRAEVRDVMTRLAKARAVVFDLRANGGGRPDVVALVCSYLFDQRVHLNSNYWRVADRTDDFFTDPSVPGTKLATMPLFVVTSARTFSAAEEFAYNLQSRKRATIVGETTRGGAHPGGYIPLPHGFFVFVAAGRSINPITKTNWEGVGVVPGVAVAADAALARALELARESQ